jgi:iron complex transport system substrate-binding protein
VRIVSLVPSATEILFALGLGDEVVAVTHECDYPPAAQALPKVTRDVLPPDLTAGQIDAAVRARTDQGEAIYQLDAEALHELAPDLIVTQALYDVRAIADELASRPQVISLDPHTLGEMLGDVRTLAEATGRRDAGVALVQDCAARIDRVRLAVRDRRRPRVVALEWLEPVYVAGHWTPQMIEYAGGLDMLGMPGEHSERRSWEQVAAAEPDVVVVMPCGYDAERAHAEALHFGAKLAGLGAGEVVAVDAAAYFSRPGPRLIDGLELLAHLLQPESIPEVAAANPLVVEL